MCLAVPARLSELHEARGVADLHGNRVVVDTSLVPEVRVGDWILMHAGFAIQRLRPEDAEATWDLLRDVEHADASLREGEEIP